MPPKKFVYDPMNDILFKFIFGSEDRKQITIEFLNVVLNRSIHDIEFKNVELVPQHNDEKMSRIDVFAVLDNQDRIDIEMQCVNYHNMDKRTLFYWAQMFLHQNSIMSGEDYNALKPAIAVNILNYSFLPNPAPCSVYSLRENETNHKLTDALELYFLEVPKLEKKPVHEMSRLDKWIAFFSKKFSQHEKEEIAMNEPAIKDAINAADSFFLDEAAYHAYLNRQAAIWDYNSGIKASREEGRAEERDSIALNMLADNEPLDKICRFTKLSIERIKELSKNKIDR
jgi:predicted transposase/invertase (TIGR01784 family)